MFTVDLTGHWTAGHVRTRWVASTCAPTPEQSAAIDQAWAQATRSEDRLLFDGPMCRLEGLDASPSALELRISPTSYRIFFGTNLAHARFPGPLAPSALANPIGVSTVLWTSDHYLLFGRRSHRVAYYPARIHPFAGSLEPDDAPDPFATVHRELSEELSLAPWQLSEVACLGLIRDEALRQPELIFTARTSLDHAGLTAALDPAEHDATVPIPATADALAKAMGHPRDWTPVGCGAALLWACRHLPPDFGRRIAHNLGVRLPVTRNANPL